MFVKLEERETVVIGTPGSLKRTTYHGSKLGLKLEQSNWGKDMLARANPATMLFMEGDHDTYMKALANITDDTEFSYRVFLRYIVMNETTVSPLLSRAYSNIIVIDCDSSENQYQNRNLILKTPEYLTDGRVTAVAVFAYNNLVNVFERWRQDGLIDYVKMYPTTNNGRRGYILWAIRSGKYGSRQPLFKYALNHGGHVPEHKECKCLYYCKGGVSNAEKIRPNPDDTETLFKKRQKWRDLPNSVKGQQKDWCTASNTGAIINVSLRLGIDGRLDPTPVQKMPKPIRPPAENGSGIFPASMARDELLIQGAPQIFLDEIASSVRFARGTNPLRIEQLLEKFEASGVSKYPKMARLIDKYIGELLKSDNPIGR